MCDNSLPGTYLKVSVIKEIIKAYKEISCLDMCGTDRRRELSASEMIGTGHGFRGGQKHRGHVAKDKCLAGGAQELRSHEGWRVLSRIRKSQPGIPAVPLWVKGPCVSLTV